MNPCSRSVLEKRTGYRERKASQWLCYNMKLIRASTSHVMHMQIGLNCWERQALICEKGGAWESNWSMSVLISSISPLIEFEKTHLAIILSVVQCLSTHFAHHQIKGWCLLYLCFATLVQLKAFQEWGRTNWEVTGLWNIVTAMPAALNQFPICFLCS